LLPAVEPFAGARELFLGESDSGLDAGVQEGVRVGLWRARRPPTQYLVHFHRLDHYELAHRTPVFEDNFAADLGKQCIVFAAAHI
jgi:hypothetical protein